MKKAGLTSNNKSILYTSRVLLALALLLLGWVVTRPFRLPDAAPVRDAGTSFSAERAMADLQEVARAPHAAGSPAQERVRAHILAQAQAVGLEAEIQQRGNVTNVIARIPGTDPTREVLITGHYDSHPPAPGAGDDGISVAAMLEAMRVLRAGPELRNDIVFLFTDGEELGWLGATAFITQYPNVKQRVGVVLCFDARPGNGPLTLRSTSPGDGWLVKQLAAARPAMWTASWFNPEERTDHDTDFSLFSGAGFTGVEIENMARGTLYHTAGDTVAAVDPSLVQSYGDDMLRLARRFGALDMSSIPAATDVTYFTVPIFGMVYYPGWLTPVVTLAAVLGLAGLMVWGLRRRQFLIGQSLLATLIYFVTLVVITLLAVALWQMLLTIFPVTREVTLGYVDFEGSAAWIAGMLVAVFCLCTAMLYLLARRMAASSLAAGGILAYLLVWWLAYFFLDADNPATTAYLAWPFFGGVAALAVLILLRVDGLRPILLFLAAVPVFVVGLPMIIYAAIQPPDGPWIPVLAFGLWLGLLVPQILYIAGKKSAASEALLL